MAGISTQKSAMPRRSAVVGLTGGISSGKSTIGKMFQVRGVPLVDADQLAREVVAPGTPGLKAIVEHFGAPALVEDGTLNRPWMRARVFADPESRYALEAITHPAIRNALVNWLLAVTGPFCILESPLLLETSQHKLCDRVLVVDVPEALQIQRACARDGVPEAQVRAIIDAQMPRALRLQKADDIIVNDGPLQALEAQFEQLYIRYRSAYG